MSIIACLKAIGRGKHRARSFDAVRAQDPSRWLPAIPEAIQSSPRPAIRPASPSGARKRPNPTPLLAGLLARWLAVRKQVGWRSSGRRIAKPLAPATARTRPPQGLQVQPSLHVVNHTHPEYALSLAQHLAESQAKAMPPRGTEGEPVADAGGVFARASPLPPAIDAATTATFTVEALSGACKAPGSIQTQAGDLFARADRLRHSLERAA